MQRHPALGAAAILLAATSVLVLAQAPKQTPKKPPAKTAPKAPTKSPGKEEAKPAPPPPDLSVTNSYVAGDKTTIGTVLMHGQRLRVSSEGVLSSIQMCDEHRSVGSELLGQFRTGDCVFGGI